MQDSKSMRLKRDNDTDLPPFPPESKHGVGVPGRKLSHRTSSRDITD